MSSIPISELNLLSEVSSSDYIPIVKDSGLTTFRTTFETVAEWISASVVASSSYSTISASYSESSSYAVSSSHANFADNLIYPNTSTASWAINSNNSLTSVSASWALLANMATSASWAPFTTTTAVPSASWASESLHAASASWAPPQISASWASSSLSSSFLRGTATGSNGSGKVSFFGTASWAKNAETASYATNVPASSGPIKAFASFTMPADYKNTDVVTILNSFNIASITIYSGKISTWNDNTDFCFQVNFVTPMSNTNYFVIGGGGEPGSHLDLYSVCAPPNVDSNLPGTTYVNDFHTLGLFKFALDGNNIDRNSDGRKSFCQFVVYNT